DNRTPRCGRDLAAARRRSPASAGQYHRDVVRVVRVEPARRGHVAALADGVLAEIRIVVVEVLNAVPRIEDAQFGSVLGRPDTDRPVTAAAVPPPADDGGALGGALLELRAHGGRRAVEALRGS